MKRSKLKFLAATIAIFTFSSVFAGCSNDKKVDDSKKDTKEIVVWSHLTEKEVAEVKTVAEQWGKDKGIKVKVQLDQGDFQAFLQAANSSKSADIMFGLAHDNLGTFQKANLLAEVPSDFLKNSDYPKVAVDALTWNGKMYGVPLSIESIALFYNKDKVKEVPQSFDKLIEDGKKVGFQYDVNNFYHSFGLISGNGGYVFKNNNGTLDPKDIGLGNEEAIKGYKMLQDMVVTDKLMPQDISGDVAKANFQSGKIAYYISGPWDAGSFKEANVNFGVSTMPKIGGNNFSPFVGVQAAFVNAKSKNQNDAWDLVKYLVKNTPEKLLATGNRIPALLSEQDKPSVKENAITSAFAKQAQNGIPMPNIPEMSNVWKPVGDNIGLLTQGKVKPEEAAKLISEQINQAIGK